jgi:ribosome maturation protein SDO1
MLEGTYITALEEKELTVSLSGERIPKSLQEGRSSVSKTWSLKKNVIFRGHVSVFLLPDVFPTRSSTSSALFRALQILSETQSIKIHGRLLPSMFTPANQKKLANVCAVTLKKYGKRYEVATYPNKLYEYRHNMTTSLSEVLHSMTIYRNVSKGEAANQADLVLFNKPNEEIIREILSHGHEQKSEATRMYELEATEKEIVDLLQKKVMKGGKYLNEGALRDAIGRVHKVTAGSGKKQSQEILSKLEAAGYERAKIRVAVGVDDRVRDFLGTSYESRDGCILVRSELFPAFRDFCARENIRYSVVRSEEVVEEEIC